MFMNITGFEHVLTLGRIETITGVAKAYFISPSTVSQCLKDEETQLGHILFKGENHRMVLTKAGWIYLKEARRILKIQRDTVDKLNVIPQKHHSVRIAAAPAPYERAASVIIPGLDTRLPGTDLQLLRADSRASVTYLLNDLADSALICSPPLDHTLLTEDVLGKDQLLLVVPGAYLRGRLAREPTIEDCNPLPFILLKSGTYTRGIENEILAKHHISPNRIYEVDGRIMVRNFLEKDRGATFLPSPMVPDHAEWHFFILPLKPPKTFNFILVYPNYTKPDKGKWDVPEVVREVFSI